MPTYQYACTSADCGNQFELVQSFTDPAASECPVCAAPVRKVFSAVGVVFKGSGFYRTDSRANGNGSTKSASSSAESGSATSSSTAKDGASSSPSSSGSSAPAKAAAAS
jgi:putative FmdB family regulatory protein